MNNELKKLLIIPHLKVHNANALSSPFTIGFPAMTAWLGATHALQRHLKEQGININFVATGIVCHHMDLQTHKGSNDFVHSIIGTGNPLDKTGSRSAFIEEARCHLDISLVIEYIDSDIGGQNELKNTCIHLLQSKMKIAGGDITHFKAPVFLKVERGNDVDLNKLKRALMPGYALIERRELMIDAMKNGADALDAMIDFLAIHHHCTTDENGTVSWQSQRKSINNQPSGWIVPIATGFHAISELGEAKNQRDQDTPHRFAESIVTLGEFKMPHRLQSAEELLWHYHVEDDLYLCQQQSQAIATNQTPDSIESEF